MQNATAPPAVQTPVARLLDFTPTDGGATWDETRAEYEREHPVLMAALRRALPAQGMLTPIQVYRRGTGWAVHNGHHRVLAAVDTLPAAPVQYYARERDIPRAPRYWDPDSGRHYGPEEDEHDEGQLRY